MRCILTKIIVCIQLCLYFPLSLLAQINDDTYGFCLCKAKYDLALGKGYFGYHIKDDGKECDGVFVFDRASANYIYNNHPSIDYLNGYLGVKWPKDPNQYYFVIFDKNNIICREPSKDDCGANDQCQYGYLPNGNNEYYYEGKINCDDEHIIIYHYNDNNINEKKFHIISECSNKD